MDDAKLSRAIRLHRQGALEQAKDHYRHILSADPENADVLIRLGVAHAQTQDPEQAVALFKAALARDAGRADGHTNLGNALTSLGRLEEAVECYRRALALTPESGDAHGILGQALFRLGRFEEAAAAYAAATALAPGSADHHKSLADSLTALARFEDAAASYRAALAIDPTLVVAHNSLGNVSQELGRFADAEASYRRALVLDPDYTDAHNNLGNALHALGRPEQAIACYRRALAVKPNDANTHSNLGLSLHNVGQLDDAMAHCRRALEINPDHAGAHSNLGISLFELGRLDEAEAHYRRAIAIEPNHAETQFNDAVLKLLRGDFKAGWAQYEWRWKNKEAPQRGLAKPVWRGEDLGRRRLLLHSEQGLGDTIQFARYACLAAERGGRVLLEVPPPLTRLMAGLAGRPEILAAGKPPPPIDCHAPLLNLPSIFGTKLDTVPAAVPYLSAEPDRIAAWRQRLGPGKEMKIGIAWQGMPTNRVDRGRSLPLAGYRPLAALAGVRLISLQQHHGLAQLAGRPSDMAVADFSADLDVGPDAFVDTAALMMSLDLVITTDTAIAHLAGALGRPTWILLKRHAEWRWLLDRTDSPWYPTARLYRQAEPGDWHGVIARVARDLAFGRNPGPAPTANGPVPPA